MSQPSAAQLAANKANAQHSTGPTSEAGKAKSSLNAVKSGLTGRTVLLPTDDVAAYQELVTQFTAAHQPANYEETELVQSLVDTTWRLRRIPNLESGIYALGRRQFAEEFADSPELIDAQIFLTFRRDLSNLSLQESRLRRILEKDLAKLEDLKAARAAHPAQQKPLDQPTTQPTQPAATSNPEPTEAQPAETSAPQIGFEFSTSESPRKKAA